MLKVSENFSLWGSFFFFFFSRNEKLFSILLKKYSDIRFFLSLSTIALKGALEAGVGIILLAQPSVRPG